MTGQLIAAGISARPSFNVYPIMQDEAPLVAPTLVRSTLPPSTIIMDGHKSIDIAAYGAGDENDVIDVSIYAVKHAYQRGKAHVERDDDYQMFLILLMATARFTLGTQMGIDGRLVDDSLRFADEVSVTVATYGTYLQNKWGRNIVASSPASNGIALVGCGDIGNHVGIWLDVGPPADASPAIPATNGNLLASIGT